MLRRQRQPLGDRLLGPPTSFADRPNVVRDHGVDIDPFLVLNPAVGLLFGHLLAIDAPTNHQQAPILTLSLPLVRSGEFRLWNRATIPDERQRALRDTMVELLAMDEPRKRIAAMLTGLDIHYDIGERVAR